MFTKAKHPERVFAGIVQQNADGDEDCLAGLCAKLGFPLEPSSDGLSFTNPNKCPYFSQVRTLRLKASDAKGPVWARAQQPDLVEEEDFCMQVRAFSQAVLF